MAGDDIMDRERRLLHCQWLNQVQKRHFALCLALRWNAWTNALNVRHLLNKVINWQGFLVVLADGENFWLNSLQNFHVIAQNVNFVLFE